MLCAEGSASRPHPREPALARLLHPDKPSFRSTGSHRLNGERTVGSATNEVEEIRRQMAQIRRELHLDMQGVVAGAEAAFDWRYYVRHYPWPSLGVAAAVGYLIVPRKRRSVSKTAEEAAEAAVSKMRGKVKAPVIELPQSESAKKVEKEKKRSGLIGALLGMVVPVAVRAAQSYASQFVENWIAQQGVLGPAPVGAGPAPRPPGPPPSRPEVRRPPGP
jgi:hypothetical protein